MEIIFVSAELYRSPILLKNGLQLSGKNQKIIWHFSIGITKIGINSGQFQIRPKLFSAKDYFGQKIFCTKMIFSAK